MISIIGLGKAGKALLKNFINAGINIESVYDKKEKVAIEIAKKYNVKFKRTTDIQSDIIFLAVPDEKIREASKNLKSKIFHIHLSGYLPSDILDSRQKMAFHPNTPLNENVNLKDVFIDLEGDTEIGKQLCNTMGAHYIEISKEEKRNLHLMAVINSNFFLALMYMSNKIFPKKWSDISRPLIYKTYENIVNLGFEKALTGPVARGDMEIVERERELFSKYFSTELYDEFIKILKEVKK